MALARQVSCWRLHAGSRILPLAFFAAKPAASSAKASGAPGEERREVVTLGGRYPKDGRLNAARFFNLQA
jgi:hypothetical protein